MSDAPPDPSPPLLLHWCYYCDTRVAVSSSDPADVICDVCHTGFVVSLPPPPPPRHQLAVDEEDDDDDDDPPLGTQFLQVIRLISQAAREAREEENHAREREDEVGVEEDEAREREHEGRVAREAADLSDDYRLGGFDFEDWHEDEDDEDDENDRFGEIENQGNLDPVNENQEEVQEDDYDNNNNNNNDNININVDEEEEDYDNNNNNSSINVYEEDDDDDDDDDDNIDEEDERVWRWREEIRRRLIDDHARRRHREVPRAGEVGVGGVARRNRILDWAEILLGLEDNSIELRLQMPEGDAYIGNPGDYVDAAGYEELLQRLAESDNGGRRGAPPASKVVVEGLETVKVNSKEEVIVCAVCKDLVDVSEVVKRLPCGHRYHGDCIVPWLSTRNSCPICRFELPTDDAEYEEERKKMAKAEKGSAVGGGSSSTTIASPSSAAGGGGGGNVE